MSIGSELIANPNSRMQGVNLWGWESQLVHGAPEPWVLCGVRVQSVECWNSILVSCAGFQALSTPKNAEFDMEFRFASPANRLPSTGGSRKPATMKFRFRLRTATSPNSAQGSTQHAGFLDERRFPRLDKLCTTRRPRQHLRFQKGVETGTPLSAFQTAPRVPGRNSSFGAVWSNCVEIETQPQNDAVRNIGMKIRHCTYQEEYRKFIGILCSTLIGLCPCSMRRLARLA